MNTLLQSEIIKQMQDKNRTLPRLTRITNTRQNIEIIAGILTVWLFGIGALLIIAWFLDYFVFSKIYRVRNASTGEKFNMKKEEFQAYKQLIRNNSNETKDLKDII